MIRDASIAWTIQSDSARARGTADPIRSDSTCERHSCAYRSAQADSPRVARLIRSDSTRRRGAPIRSDEDSHDDTMAHDQTSHQQGHAMPLASRAECLCRAPRPRTTPRRSPCSPRRRPRCPRPCPAAPGAAPGPPPAPLRAALRPGSCASDLKEEHFSSRPGAKTLSIGVKCK